MRKLKMKRWKKMFYCQLLLAFNFTLAFALELSPILDGEGSLISTNEDDPIAEKLIYRDDSLSFSRRFIHRLDVEARPGYVIPTNSFLKGDNVTGQKIMNTFSTHLRYSFKSQPNTCADLIYGGAYQGIGFALFKFDEPEQLGKPYAFYLFQGARMFQFAPWLSLNYEWNFGLSAGWRPYGYDNYYYNTVIGSKLNAYMNVNFYLNWMLSRQFDLATGVDISHFSNGNTKFPNAGLNTMGVKVGLVYNFNREAKTLRNSSYLSSIPEFNKHVSYDLVLFGSWRRKGVAFGEEQVASPHAYTVLGFNFAPMYNLGYKLRAGVSLDGVYDGSANVYTEDYISGTEQEFYTPSLSKQMALGVSGRIEYVMPFFTVNFGMGVNVLHRGGDLKSFYQILALKAEITRNSFLHIGYCLESFHDPNYLMLGIGFRFNNKYPFFRH